ncbi:gamma-glutamyltranspeptidase/glutathione hydrolase [Paenibacillus sp. V4I9]|uniref:gamma-glutamyltransferase family protein n=1 Tax=Paenibacillus sp. V4I9 TaxID=3042308 RepID=UPI002781B9DF|nr:gamma-glutamyltransferase family protein [Paenibacillus sp. V4I9]MDQ0885747.1 gamma-glutamyltranspeptidase/glutathione hydrolase [Paenibacillus sp. V4I9]
MGNQHQYGVSSAHPLATEAGMSVLKAGGNAADAAIAVSYMLSVVEPYASGIGGGGVMLILPAKIQESIVCDYREVAPMSGVISPTEVGVPGFVKGMEKVHELFGTLDMETLMDPAISVAEAGFASGAALHRQLVKSPQLIAEQHPSFFPEGEAIRQGEWLKQPVLAKTMRAIRDNGSDWFYQGELGQQISAMVDGMTQDDFRDYRVSMKKPVYSEYDNYDVITSPPPFGGVTLIQALKISELLELHEQQKQSIYYIHHWGEVIRKCYELRQSTMGDPDFCSPPVQRLISRELIGLLADNIRPDIISEIPVTLDDVANTTHFSIMDKDGMCVSATNTIGGFFGPGIEIGGFFLNNQMRNFTNDAISPNQVQPGKRPQSYVCPTIIRNHERTIVIGSAGGKRIPMILSVILENVIKKRIGLEEAVAASRFFIDEKMIYVESPLPDAVADDLVKLGYEVVNNADPMYYGGIHGLMRWHDTGQIVGAADPRRGGVSQVRE